VERDHVLPEARRTSNSSPGSSRRIMAGISALLGLSGEALDTRGILVSAFYHF